jgi:hypothetical protein
MNDMNSTSEFLMRVSCVGYIDNERNRSFLRMEWEMRRQQTYKDAYIYLSDETVT